MISHVWTPVELGRLMAAASAAPSVLDCQPWTLRLHGPELVIARTSSPELAAVDPGGRRLLISCGAVVTNVSITMRALGWRVRVVPFPSVRQRHDIASVRPAARAEPAAKTLRLARAIRPAPSGHGRSRCGPLTGPLVSELKRAGSTHGVRVTQLDGDGLIEFASCLDAASQESPSGTVLALSTDTTSEDDNLAVGMAMQQLILTAIELGVDTSPEVLALETSNGPSCRHTVTRTGPVAQVLIRAREPLLKP